MLRVELCARLALLPQYTPWSQHVTSSVSITCLDTSARAAYQVMFALSTGEITGYLFSMVTEVRTILPLQVTVTDFHQRPSVT